MKILITGGTGYLGRQLIRQLLKEDHEVFCVHRKTSDLSVFQDITSGLYFLENDADRIRSYVNIPGHLPDFVILAACSYEAGLQEETILESNLLFPLMVLRTLQQAGCKSFLSIGTALPKELNLYALTKRQFDEYGANYAERFSVRFTSILLENYYGPKEPSSRFIPACIEKLKQNEKILLTSGTQKRDFIHIEDVISGILLLLQKPLPGYEEIPLGSGYAPSIRELLSYLKELTHSCSELCFGALPDRKHEPSSAADLTRMHSLGFKPKYSWKEGIKTIL